MVKILASIRNFRDRLRTSISLKVRNILFFIAIFLVVFLTILLRISPILRGTFLIKAFDPWIQWYNAEYLNTHTIYEYFNWVDLKSWNPQGIYRGGLRPGLTFTVVAIYKILHFFGIPISLYYICYFFPAIMGGLTVLVIYFLGKEVLNRSTGLLAAFFLAFNPGFLQRTTAGFFDNETIGVFASLMTFLFFLKAVKHGKFTHSVIGGIFLGYLSLSWGGYQFVFLIIPIISIVLVLTNKYNENVLISYAGVQGTGLLVFSLYTLFRHESLFSSLEIGGIFLFTIILIIFHIIQIKKNDHPNFYKNLINIIKWALIPGILILAVIVWIAPDVIPFGFGARFNTILSPLLRRDMALVASIAEQMPSAWSVFYYDTLIPVLLISLGIFFCFKRLNAADIFLIAFILLMYYFTGSMIRIILIFAPAAALIGAYGLVNILKIFGSFTGEKKVGVSRKRRRQLKGTVGNTEVLIVYLVIGILLYSQVTHTSLIAIQQHSYVQMVPGGVIHDWEETLTWMKANLKGTDVVVSWWDYGYWLTPIGNVTTVNDNATKNGTRIGLTGMALMQTNEIYSAKAFRRLGADYVLVYFGFLYSGLGGDEGKWTWMLQICNNHYVSYKNSGWEEDNWADNAVFDESKYHNLTNGRMEDSWFDSQLVKLMFFGEKTNPDEANHQFDKNYAQEINRRADDNGQTWKSHIPDNGLYNTIVFVPTYFSRFHMVKLYKIDYTALDSSFTIRNAEVFDSGYGTIKLQNTGKKDLTITNVKINGLEYDYVMSNESNTIEQGEEDMVWIDIESQGTTFQKDDVVSIEVDAESVATYGPYSFSNHTSNFFVKEAIPGEIRINKQNSIVIQKNQSHVDIFLEVENIGDTTTVLDRFYLNDDTIENRINETNIEYLSGALILEPGEIANVYLPDVSAIFSLTYPILYNKIGVATPNDIRDEILFTSNIESYSLSILSEERIISPEVLAALDRNFRKHIPIDFSNSYAYRYDNGSTILNIKVKNTGDLIFGLDSVYLTESLTEVDFEKWHTISTAINLESNTEDVIIIDATDYVGGDINEEILVCITGSYGTTVTSDIGYIHTIRDQEDIQIIENIDGSAVSYINANETGTLLIKNTGNAPITLVNVTINSTLSLDFSNPNEIEFLYGDSSLGIQECALIYFDIPGFQINKSNEVIAKITTNSTAEYETVFNAIVDSELYSITVDPASRIDDSDNRVTIKIVNDGQLNVTVDSIYINSTYIPLSSFTFQIGDSFVIGNLGGSITIYLNNLESFIGSISPDDKFIILARTLEGAEDTQEEIVVA
ncbi:MAG: STT3 domain-containing protein [Candidatus Hodarchaeota archaeon]